MHAWCEWAIDPRTVDVTNPIHPRTKIFFTYILIWLAMASYTSI